MIKGSCVCGGVKFEIEKVVAPTHCHCSVCRKENGASFATFAHVRRERFKLVAAKTWSTPDTNGPPVIRGASVSDAARPRRNISRQPERWLCSINPNLDEAVSVTFP